MANHFMLARAEVRFGPSVYPLTGLEEAGLKSFARYEDAIERTEEIIDALTRGISGLTRDGVKSRLTLSFVDSVVDPDSGRVLSKSGICAMGDGFYVFWREE